MDGSPSIWYIIEAAILLHSYCTVTTFVQGYKQQRAYIIAQSPMESTARDFWKMVTDRKCGVIVMLCQLEEDGKVGQRI